MPPNVKAIKFNFFGENPAQPLSQTITFVSLVAALRGPGELAPLLLTDGVQSFPLYFDDEFTDTPSYQTKKLQMSLSYGRVYKWKNLRFSHSNAQLTVSILNNDFIYFTKSVH